MDKAYVNPRANLISRSRFVALILAAASLIVTIRLADIQIFHADQYKKSATNAQWTDEIIPAKRGAIYDANGTVIAQSAQTWKLYLIPEEMTDEGFRQQVCKDVAQTLNLDYDELMELTKTEPVTDPGELVIAHKKDVKSQMELSEKKLINGGKGSEAKNGDCLMHKV